MTNTSTNLKELNNSNFTETINTGVTLVDFWAAWCMPCRMQAPILEQVSQKIGDKAKIAKLNVDENPGIASQYGIFSIPTLILFKDGKPVKQFVGVQPGEVLLTTIQNLK